MASITKAPRKHGEAYYIAYRTRVSGKAVQHKFRCQNKADAEHRLPDVLRAESENREYVPYESSSYAAQTLNVSELVDNYMNHHAKDLSASTVRNYEHIAKHYIKPFVGDIPIDNVTTALLQRYYDDLPNHPAVQGNHKLPAGNISARTVREVHKILRPAFRLALKWGLISSNPANDLDLPSTKPYERQQWTENQMMTFVAKCEDDIMKIATSLMFSGTLRSGELLGLTWDSVDISDQAIAQNCCFVRIEKTIERLDLESVKKSKNDILKTFPTKKVAGKTVLVLKRPKTVSSVRKVYIPASVAKLLAELCRQQQEYRILYGEMYNDHNLIFCHDDGSPYTTEYFGKRFKRIVKELGLEPVDVYSLRHSGATAKLRATGNIKAVQGDMGHSSTNMLLNVYAGIRDEDRRNIATTIDELWFSGLNEKDNPDY